ncbi:MAG: ferritin family protein [Candidatus Zophobacter franzmannii]|nr:ferritin family protein [Candidatus Zophobacter franzmannii]
MRELNLKEIISYAKKIEFESFGFYKNAAEMVSDKSVKDILEQLASDETGHYNRLRSLEEEESISKDNLEKSLQMDSDLLELLVNSDKIEPGFTGEEVLNIALKREINTAKAYEMFLTFTSLNQVAIEIFEQLRLQELGHITKIENRLKKV